MTLPVFARPGTILPIEPLVQSTEEQSQGPLTLRVFPGPNCAGEIYRNEGKTFAYKRGEFLRVKFTCESSTNGDLAIHIGRHQGRYPSWWKEISVEVNGLSGAPKSITVNGETARPKVGAQPLTLVSPDPGTGIDISLRLGKQ